MSIPKEAIALFDPIRADIDALAKLNAEAVFDYEAAEGNKLARSHVYKLRLVKGRIAEAHKVAKAEALEVCKTLDGLKRDYTGQVDAMIEVHEKPLRDIEEREAQAKYEEAMRVQREKDEAERKVLEEQEARQREIERKEAEIRAKEDALRQREEEASRREAEVVARREAAERAEAERLAAAERERVEAEARAKRQAEQAEREEAEKAKAAAMRDQAVSEATADLMAMIDDDEIPSSGIVQAIIDGKVRHVRFAVEG